MTDTSLAHRQREIEKELAKEKIRWIKGGWYNRMPALFIRCELAARIIAALVAALLVLGMVVLLWEANARFGVPYAVRPFWFQFLQLLLALATLAAAAVETAYLAYYTVSKRVWPRLRGVSIAYAVLSSVWIITWLLDRFVFDALFFDWVIV